MNRAVLNLLMRYLLRYIADITPWCKHIKFIFEWKKEFTSECSEQVTSFFPREDKLHMIKPTCNFLFMT